MLKVLDCKSRLGRGDVVSSRFGELCASRRINVLVAMRCDAGERIKKRRASFLDSLADECVFF